MTIIVVCLIIISVSIYYILGGFEPVNVYLIDGTSRVVIGKEYFIPDDREAFFQKMDSARMDIENEKLKGDLTAVIYENDTIAEDMIHCFIGASRDGIKGVVRMPAGFKFRQFTTDQIFKVFITQHWLVQPLPEEIEEMIQVRSIEEGKVLQPLTFEVYYPDNSLSVEKWAK